MSVRKIAGSKDLKIEKAGWWIFATWSFDITGTRWRVQMDHEGYHEAQESIAKSGAAPIVQQDGRKLWWTNDGLFWADADLDDEEVALILKDRQRKHEARIDRLRKQTTQRQREPISRDVQAAVWKRDNGRCVRCGTEDDLQFDHIIPVAKGGGNAADNIQVMCGDCNRRKGASIG